MKQGNTVFFRFLGLGVIALLIACLSVSPSAFAMGGGFGGAAAGTVMAGAGAGAGQLGLMAGAGAGLMAMGAGNMYGYGAGQLGLMAGAGLMGGGLMAMGTGYMNQYGAQGAGLMGAVADAVIEHGGTISGVIPEFMVEMEWAHPGIDQMKIVNTMHERKTRMVADTDALIALPGGSGTLEELLESITLKRLGLYINPIIIINTCNFFEPLLTLFENAIRDHFMDEKHRHMWTVIPSSKEIIEAIKDSIPWTKDARNFAAL